MHVLFLRAKQVNQASLEEMGCLAKMEFRDYQGSKCVCLCVRACTCVLFAVFIRSLPVSSWCNLLFRAF